MTEARRAARLAGLRAVGGLLAGAEVITGRRIRRNGPGLRILIVRPDHLGDVLLAAPAGRLLADGLPGAEIDWLVGPWAAEIVRRSGQRCAVLTCDFPGFTRRPKRRSRSSAMGVVTATSASARRTTVRSSRASTARWARSGQSPRGRSKRQPSRNSAIQGIPSRASRRPSR